MTGKEEEPMETAKFTPITWTAASFEVGDKFSIPPQEMKVYTVVEIRERHDLVEIKASLYSLFDEEEWGIFNLTFPADFLLTARQRIRTVDVECMLCKEPARHTLDTAYSTYSNGVCGKH